MSYGDTNPETHMPLTTGTSSFETVQKLKLYQAFIFSVPVCFTFIVLFVFYIIYLRQRSSNVDWSSLGMRGNFVNNNNLSMIELGISKEVREMLPIVVFKESFSVKDSQCSVCLGDYEADDKLQQMPACGHTFHMDCIDKWLTSHTTCPLCRLSLIPKSSPDQSNHIPDPDISHLNNADVTPLAQPESNPTEAVSLDEGQDSLEEGHVVSEVIKEETQENVQNSLGTSNASCDSRLC